jgi:hypothetical protein
LVPVDRKGRLLDSGLFYYGCLIECELKGMDLTPYRAQVSTRVKDPLFIDSPSRVVVPLFLVTFCLLQLCFTSSAIGIICHPPLQGVDRAVSFWDVPLPRGLSLADSSIPALALNTKGFRRNVSVDPEKWIISFEEEIHGLKLKTPLVYDLSSFIQVRAKENLPRYVREKQLEALFAEEKGETGRGGINIDIPVKFPKAISKIIGEGGGLKITGYRNISFSGRSEWTDNEVQTATYKNSKFPSLVMEQRSQFKIEGTIGEKIHVYVDQDSERMTELENAIRINYEGFEDEIVQEIQAGNTSLSLPQTQFVSFSQKSTGLFGIKATAKIGPLDLVTIASQDKGSGQRKTFQAGAESEDQEIADYNYRTGYYYFLDHYYMENYENYELIDPSKKWIHVSVPADSTIDSLLVFVDDVNTTNNPEEGARKAYAYVNPSRPDSATDESYEGYFRLLNIDEYFVNEQLGYIRLNTQLRDGWVLAVAYKKRANRNVSRLNGGWVGSYNNDPTDTTAANISKLKLLRPHTPRPGQITWDLEWKNVYYLGATNISDEGFDIRILLDKSGEEDDDSQSGVKYVTIMGLDRRNNQNQSTVGPDGFFDFFDVGIVSLTMGELIFPTLRPFDTNMTFEVDTTLSIKVPDIYDKANDQDRRQAHKYNIAVQTQNRAASYNLGINIIEGSEVVKLNGQPLQRNRDYNIIYEIGQITFLTQEALDPAADISVDYETAPFFQPERKTLLGVRGEYSFWDDASWGATLLYRSESMPLDRRIRLGQEPTRAMVWDSDLHLNFEPQILTDVVDALPLVRTNTPSSLKISGEVAQSLPNSNTKGEAYVDDFDGSKNTTTLNVMRGQWTLASPPTTTSPYSHEDAQTKGQHSIMNRAQYFYWYNPYEQVDVKEIWPNREAYAREGRTHVLAFEFMPSNLDTNSWGGVMRNLSQGNYNQSRSKYIEVWVNGNRGRVNIDLGLIHEDVIPNRKINSEDKGAESGQGDNLLDLDEDIGLDGMANNDSRAESAGGDFWDVNGNDIKDDWEPFSNDDWSYQSGSSNYTKINGTEDNRNDPDRGIRPDTEDLDGDGILDTENSFFRYTFSLSPNSPDTIYVAGGDLDRSNWGHLKSWRLYRIPLDQPSLNVDNADITNIQYARIWITGVGTYTRIRFAAFDIVGNDWLEDGILANEGRPVIGGNEAFAVTVKNTHDNPDDYSPPPSVAGVIDPVTKLQQMEQSLVLKFENLSAGHSGSASQVYTGKSKDFTKYRTLRMYVYGDLTSSAGPGTGAAKFFFRFGADTSNYYEYNKVIYSDTYPDQIYWDPRNEVVIDFDELTNLKYQQVGESNAAADTVSGDYRIYGKPSLSDIRRLTVGVKSLAYSTEAKGVHDVPIPWERVSGEVWIDELRLTNARDDPGVAGRINVDAKLADLGAISVRMSKTDAEFQSLGGGSTSDSQKLSKQDESIQGSVNLNKFLPDNWGMALPFSGSYSKTTQLPKLRRGSDVNLNKEAQWDQRTENTTKSASIRFSKQASSFWLLGLTLDKMSFSFSGSEKEGRSTTNPYTLNRQLTGSFSYNLSTNKDLSISPFGWTGSKFVPSFFTGTKFTLIPSSISFDTNVSQTRTHSVDRHQSETSNFVRTTNQKFSSTLKPFGSVSTNFSFNRKLDSQNAQIKKLRFGREMDRSQSVSLSYKPPILTWLGPNYSYRVNYHEKENTKVLLEGGKFGRDADNSISHSVSASLNASNLLTSIGAPKKGDEVKVFSPRGALGLVRSVTDRLQSVSGSLQRDRRSNWFNLKGRPTLAYQFGTQDEPGVESDTTLTGRPKTSSSGQSWNAKSGVNLFFGVSVSGGISSDYKSNIASTGQTDSRTLTFPQVSTRWGDFGKLYLIRNLVQNSSIDFSYTEKKTEDGTADLTELYSESISKNFSPLFSWSATWARNLSSSLSSNRSYTENINHRQSGAVTTQTTESLQASIKYSFNAPQGVKLPGLGKVKFQSNLNVNLDYKLNKSINETKGLPDPTKDDQTKSYTLGGSYSFSKKVKGGLKFEHSRRDDKKTNRETQVWDVGIWTEIRFD